MSGAFAYPVFLEVRGRRCLVVGGGHEAREKAESLADLGARVIVSDARHELTGELSERHGVELHTGPFNAALLDGVFLVIAANEDRAERRRVAAIAREAGTLVSAVDENDLCDWAAPAVLRRGGLTLAIGTGGVAPALAVRLRDRLAETFGPELGTLLELFGEVRPRIMASGRSFSDRRRLWYELVDGEALEDCRAGRIDEARATIDRAIGAWEAAALIPGRVWLVGAGPGDPELITVKGRRLIEQADAVVHDRLVGPGVLALIPTGVLRIDVGKTGYGPSAPQAGIDATLVRLARAGLDVVRLKGGDPFVFGRGGEEAAALSEAGIPFEVVPGVTAGIAAPALAGIPVTHRGTARSVAFVTAASATDASTDVEPDWGALAGIDTLVVYMAGRTAASVARRLVHAGRSPATPAAFIVDASLSSQEVHVTDLATLVAGRTVPPTVGRAALLVVGDVVAIRERIGLHPAGIPSAAAVGEAIP